MILLFIMVGLLLVGLFNYFRTRKAKKVIPVSNPIPVFTKPQPLPVSEKKGYYYIKGKRWRYKKGNFLGATISLSPESYGAALLKRDGYSHKRTNK